MSMQAAEECRDPEAFQLQEDSWLREWSNWRNDMHEQFRNQIMPLIIIRQLSSFTLWTYRNKDIVLFCRYRVNGGW